MLTLQQLPDGVELWRGPSRIDGSPIVVLASMRSANPKTGNMVQTWILRADMGPRAAVSSGADAGICGDCPHRGDGTGKGRTCYVTVDHAPRGIWSAWQRGKYPAVAPSDLPRIGAGRMVRLGAYGDPAAVPVEVWTALVSRAQGHTGYTHQWRRDIGSSLRTLCMASCDSEADARAAWEAGWRTFRVRRHDGGTLPGEVVCPASDEGGKRTTCERCRLCSGNPSRPGLRPGIVIIDHGPRSPLAVAKRQAGRKAKREREAAAAG
jgi:hypothetical protein